MRRRPTRPTTAVAVLVVALSGSGCRERVVPATDEPAATGAVKPVAPSSEPAIPPARTADKGIGWHRVGIWNGRGPMQTESFGSDGSLRFRWTAKSSDGEAGWLRITLRSAVSGRSLAVPVDHRGDGQDTAYVSETPRDFYVEVDSRGTEWSFSVDEVVSGR